MQALRTLPADRAQVIAPWQLIIGAQLGGMAGPRQ
jgi:hypothetical protein